MAHSKRKRKKNDWRKAMGLRRDYPLFPHPAGYWAKKVRGKLFYFGKVADDPRGEAAEIEWDRVKRYRLAGKEPPPAGEYLSVRDLCNRFCTAKIQRRNDGWISPLTFEDYKKTCARLVDQWGDRPVTDLQPDDFAELRAKLAKTRGIVGVGNEIVRTRAVFNFAYEQRWIASEVPFGDFKRPDKATLRKLRASREAEHGKKVFDPAEIQRLLRNATANLKAMILLGVNCGFGNSDCGRLPLRAVDLDSGWVEFPRPKTGAARRCPLWPETVRALRESLAARRQPKDSDHAGRFFITAALGSYHKATTDSPIAKEFAKLVKELKLERQGRGFYSLRHTFRTVARGAKDLEAVRFIMGHESGHIEDSYIHADVDDARLQAVAEHVRAWLYPPKPAAGDKATSTAKSAGSSVRQSTASGKARLRAEAGEPSFQFRIVG